MNYVKPPIPRCSRAALGLEVTAKPPESPQLQIFETTALHPVQLIEINSVIFICSLSASRAVIDELGKDRHQDNLEHHNVQSIIARCDELSLLGQYKSALDLLGPLIDDSTLTAREILDVFRATAQVFVLRGYPRAAKECIEKALGLPSDKLDKHQLLVLNIHHAFITIVGCGEELENDECLRQGRDWLKSLETFDAFERQAVEIESYLSRIALVRQQLCHRRGADVKAKIAARLQPLMLELQDAHRFFDMWKLFSAFSNACGSEMTAEWLEELLDSDSDIPITISAPLTLQLASIYAENGHLDKCSVRLDQADAAFTACGHSHGSFEVKKYRLHYGLSTSANAFLDLVKIIEHFCAVEYPLGVLQSTSFPLQQAFNKGDFRTYFQLQHAFHNICKIAGILHGRLQLEIQLLGSLNIGTGHYGKVKELGMAIYYECVAHKYWSLAFYVGQILSLAENQMGNQEQALLWATKIFELCKRENLEAESTAAYNLAHTRSFIHDSSPAKAIETANDIISLLEPYIEQDLNNKAIRSGCDKLCLIANLNFKIARLSAYNQNALLKPAYAVLDRIFTISETSHGRDKTIIRGNCEEMRVIQLLYEGRRSMNNVREEEAIQIIDCLIHDYKSSGLTMEEANKYQIRAMCNVQMWQKDKRMKFMVAAEESLRLACQKFEAISSLQFLLGCRHELCRLYVAAWEFYGLGFAYVFRELKLFEGIADTIRRELSALGSLPALLQKQQFAATNSVKDLYEWAIGVSSIVQDTRELWHWSQKRKARSLSDMLGLGVIVPARMKGAIEREPKATELYQKLSAAQSRLMLTSPNERGFIRQEISELESKIRDFPMFGDYLALRDGSLSGVEELQTMIEQIPPLSQTRKTVFVDWVIHREDVYMLVANGSSSPIDVQFFKLDVTVTTIKRWIQQNFSTDKDRKSCLNQDSIRDPDSPLRALDPLITNLQRCTDPNDLLLLSPTGYLFSLPLHALKIWDEISECEVNLIARNPVVYVPSMSVLKICLSRVDIDDEKETSIFLGVFDKATEARNIYTQVVRLAHDFRGKSASGQHVSKLTFGNLIKGARLIHFHGHCEFSATNVLQQSLVLSNPKEGSGLDESLGHNGHDSLAEPANNQGSEPSTTYISLDADLNASKTSKGMLDEAASNPSTVNVDDKQNVESLLVSGMDLNPIISTAGEETMLHLDSQIEATNLTVEEIFTLPLSAPLVTLIACASASQTIATGDEPLGLIAGLLCAGAASVVGASWPVQSRTGRDFSDHFYKEIREAKGNIVDIAVALQKAVLNIKDEKRTSGTYHWAAFTLYGSWLFKKLPAGG